MDRALDPSSITSAMKESERKEIFWRWAISVPTAQRQATLSGSWRLRRTQETGMVAVLVVVGPLLRTHPHRRVSSLGACAYPAGSGC